MPQTWLVQLPLLILAFARCAGALCLAPPLAWRHFPVGLRLAVAAVLSLPLVLVLQLPGCSALVNGGGWLPSGAFLALLAREVATGAVLGLGLWLLVFAAAAGGRLAESGLFEEVEEDEGPLGTLLVLLVILFFLQLNGLPWLLNALRESYQLLPLAAGADSLEVVRACLYWPARLFGNLLLVGAPLLVATLLASWLVASVQRCLPGLSAAQAAPAARHLALLLALLAVVPLFGGLVLGQLTDVAQAASEALLRLARP